ncbi:MAG: cysteine hydrolase [Eubacteriaceae bacterium]|nr:cysteine hydrolase [Eubacteriaceae bacterium]
MILLVIDMQKGLVNEDLYAFDTFIERTTQLVDVARKYSVEVVFIQHDAGLNSGMTVGDEAFEIIDRIAPIEGEKVFVKTINSCFGNKDLKMYLKKQTDRRLMIIGLQTNYCIDATVKSAFERGYEVIIPEGTNSTFDNDYMSGETTVRYYNEDVWEDLVNDVTFEESLILLKNDKL